jgi:mannose-6-phosphate isomerase-like protein (cupin superfamily)
VELGQAERSAGPRQREPLVRHLGGFRWDGVAVRAYKPEGAPFRGVTRQVLFGEEESGASELRYFEVEPGGWTTLERHTHVHQVVVLQGRGRALVGERIVDLAPLDCLGVPARTWHQLRAAPDAPLGFLCLVDRERDRPERPAPGELARLRARPELAEFIR